jgi:hypothetical protein
MGQLPRALEEKRVKLLALARRRAFESYIRYGRVPALHEQAAAFAVGAEKALGPGVDVSLAGLPSTKPTSYYTWRSAGDERVRSSHAALNGRIFTWDAPPAHGHPGSEPNCRCWAEPYYGNRNVPDALLKLAHERQVDAIGTQLWASIETLTRPDGSLVESGILGRDGTQFRSSFSGSSVRHVVTLPAGDKVRFETTGGVQSIYLADDGTPLLQSAWTANGPVVRSARRQLAFLARDPSGLFDYLGRDNQPGPASAGGMPAAAAGGLSLIGLAAFALQAMQQAAPAAMGVGPDDVSFTAFKAWAYDGKAGAVPVMVDALTAEQVRQSCERLPEVQKWADKAADALTSERPNLSAQSYGSKLHKLVKDDVDAMKEKFPVAYAGISAELSFDNRGDPVYYSKLGSTRLDILEEVPPKTPEFVCVYDVKTGGAELGGNQFDRIVALMIVKYPGVSFFVIQIKPFNDHGR